MPYYNEQLKASYILPKIKDYINSLSDDNKENIYSLFKYNSNFEIITNFKLKSLPISNKLRVLSLVAQNIVQRGKPTIAPVMFNKFDNDSSITLNGVLRSLIIYDSQYVFDKNKRYYQKTDSGYLELADLNRIERSFLSDKLNSRIAQHVEIQKPLSNIVKYPNTDAKQYNNYTSYCLGEAIDKIISKVKEQRVDFAIQLPRLNQSLYNCMAIELDGPQHSQLVQSRKDRYRDELTKELLWAETLRIKNIDDADSYKSKIDKFFEPYFTEIAEAWQSMPSILIPLYAARFTMIFLRLIEHGVISIFNDKKTYITANVSNHIEEESLLLGIQNGFNLIAHLVGLEGTINKVLGELYIKINKNMYRINTTYYYPMRQQISQKPDVHIFSHMNQRLFAFDPDTDLQKQGRKIKNIWVYSAYGSDSDNIVRTNEKPIEYHITKDNEKLLEYFVQNIFFKPGFRPKQLDIIKEALCRKNVIGLLPTGSGKTLTYQLSALLQPSITMIIAPLVSLMNDQVNNLNKNNIDSCATINSSFSGDIRRITLCNFRDKQYQFIYVAPERLQIKGFKVLLDKLPIAYVVLDEAHCVSQWGHDFRTSYLRVGETIENYIPNAVTMALTGTASCNVITDIKRELNMKKNVTIVTPTDFRRKELHFKICQSPSNDSLEKRVQDDKLVDKAIDEAIDYLCQIDPKHFVKNNMTEERREFFSKTNNEYKNAALVFCPFAKKKIISAQDICNAKKESDKLYANMVDYYHGQLKTDKKNEVQENFTNNKIALLYSTKAFGMGIDKPNIRFTVHTCVPESIEAFYQEAGRAGRDKNIAVNIIVTPPLNSKYNDIPDKSVYDFFLEQSFPNKEAFKSSAYELLSIKKMDIINYNDVLIREINKKEIPGDINFDYDCDNDEVILNIKTSDHQNHKYNVRMDTEREIEIKRKSDNFILNFLYEIYETFIKGFFSDTIKDNEKINANNFNKTFNMSRTDTSKSIIEGLIEATQSDKEIYCYIGLDNKRMLTNPVDDILRELLKNREMLSLDVKLKKDIEKQQRLSRHDRFNYDIKNFYPIYKRICDKNKLEILNLKAFEALSAQISRDNNFAPIQDIQEKVLYYLGILGLYSDYERAYSPDYIKVKLNKINAEYLKDRIKQYISGYETADYVRNKVNLSFLAQIGKTDIENLVKKSLEYIIDYSYDKIRTYRIKQNEVMYKCLQAYNYNNREIDNIAAFTEEIYKYFESKYSEQLLHDIENENLALALKWINKIEQDVEEKNENLLENLSHLRSSALKVEEARPQSYTPYILYAYATIKDHNLDIASGINSYIEGVTRLSNLRTRYRADLKRICYKMLDTEDKEYLKIMQKILDQQYFNLGGKVTKDIKILLYELTQVLQEKLK